MGDRSISNMIQWFIGNYTLCLCFLATQLMNRTWPGYELIDIGMIVSSFPFKHQHALMSVISWHWLESVFMFPLIFGSPLHFSIQTEISLSHTVPEHSAFLSSLIFPHRIVFASSIVLVTWTKQASFHLNSYMGSWDSITSASSSLVALLVLSTWFFICFW